MSCASPCSGAARSGSALVGILQDRADALAVQCGARLEVGGIAVSDLTRARAPHIPVTVAHRRRPQLVADPSIDVVVELIGGRGAGR